VTDVDCHFVDYKWSDRNEVGIISSSVPKSKASMSAAFASRQQVMFA
jgi:hypothetical protein